MKNRNLTPYSRRHRLGNLDRRTYESKLLEGFRAELIKHVGGSPTVTQAALIERAAWVNLHCALMDSKVASGNFTEFDSKVYLAWAGALARLLARLGLEPAASSPRLDALSYAEAYPDQQFFADEARAKAAKDAA